MNKARRAQLKRALELLEQANSIIDEVREGESDAYDAMPESLQCSERGEQMESNVCALDDALDEVGDLQEVIEDIIAGVC